MTNKEQCDYYSRVSERLDYNFEVDKKKYGEDKANDIKSEAWRKVHGMDGSEADRYNNNPRLYWRR